jgi:Flp pilus assembly pilin Flp
MPLTLDAMVDTIRAFIREDGGQDLIEYAYLAAFIGVTGYVTLNGIVPAVATTYDNWINPNRVGSVPSLWEPAEAWTSSGS